MSLKRIVCLALAAVLLAGAAASFSGCRKKQQAVKEIADHVYRSQTLKIGDGDAGNTYVEQFTRIGDGIYASVYSYDPETYESTRLLYRVDPDTGALSSVDVPKTELGENTNEQTLMPAGDGTFWQIYYTYFYDELTYEYSETYVLRRIDGNGKEFCSVDLSALWGENTDDEWHYVDQTFPLGDALLLSDSTSLYRFEKDGTVSAKLSLRDLSEEGGYIRSIFGDENDTQILYYDYSMSMSLGKGSSTFLIPITWGERPAFGERQELPEEIFQYANTITTGPGYSLYFTDENGVYGYDAAAQTKTLLLDFLNSDLSSSMANNLIVISPDRFVTYGYDDVVGGQTAMILTRVPEEEIVPKYILTLAVVGGLWSVRNPVLLFNRQSEEYRIKIKLYNPDDYYDPLSADDYDWNDLVQKTVRVTEDNDPVAAWKAHDEAFRARCAWLNAQHFDSLHYRSANGTDFRVGLIPEGRFCGGGETSLLGHFFNPNMPTEEIFVSPKRGAAEGRLVSTMPLSWQGQLIEDFAFDFKDGRAVSWEAKKGKELLDRMLGMDEGAPYLGEVALVPKDSPISESGILFYNTLFDENASCHVAFGRGYMDTIDGYADRTQEECHALGVNDSMIHVDFMIGAPDLSITGYKDGKATPVFTDGTWAEGIPG